MSSELKFKKTNIDRFFEKVPAMATWGIILFVLIGSFFIPWVVAVFVLLFNVFFLYRSLAWAVQYVLSLFKLRSSEQLNWQERLEGLEDIDGEIKQLEDAFDEVRNTKFSEEVNLTALSNKYRSYGSIYKFPDFVKRFVFRMEKNKTKRFIRKEIERLCELREVEMPSYEDLHHVIMIPHAKEPLGVLEETLRRLKKQDFPTKQISIVLGAEARDPEGYTKSKILKDKYEKYFGNIWISVHELGENEIVGKSSNMAAAGREAKKQIDKLGWDKRLTTVTSCDADSKLPENYFSILSYNYLTRPDREFKFYTGVILFYANIWRIDFVARVRNSLASMYNVAKMVRPDKFIPFSTYSTSFWLVEEIGFWTPWITPEDFHLFFKASFKFSRKVSTIPLLTRILVDAAEGDNPWDTFKNNYFQSRRWQWGVSDDGWVLKNMVFGIGKLNWVVYYRGVHVLVDHILAPTSSFLLILGANLPPALNPQFANTVFGARLSNVSSNILQFTLAALIVVIIMDSLVRPKRDGVSLLRRMTTPLEWLINPFVGLLLTSIPGLEAHTRLLFGKHLEYYITKKKAD
ncbi:hypothetical protein GF389_02485 [Candidatus Dojkabacteria bacterium]|nr:hypothetical protein [Candidatus Dojkabacteria bacterium]